MPQTRVNAGDPDWVEVGYPRTCSLDKRSRECVLVYEHGADVRINERDWTQAQLYEHAKENTGLRISCKLITSSLVEIYQRDCYPPDEQAAYAHYPNQGSSIAAVKLSATQRRAYKHIYIITRKWVTWTCDGCGFRNKYEAESFKGALCQSCGHESCEDCSVESKERTAEKAPVKQERQQDEVA